MKLYIIGNGFDRAHDIKCGYNDFMEFLGENYPNYYQCLVYGYNGSGALWFDFENELPNCATYIEESGLQMGNELLADLDYDPMDDMSIGHWLDEQYNFLYKLPDYLRLWVESIDIGKKPVLNIDSDSLYLNFNYTATLEKVYGIDEDNITHIHGYVENKNEELIIGHCNTKAIEYARKKKVESQIQFVDHAVSTYERAAKYCEATIKPSRFIIEQHQYFFDQLKIIDSVEIIGHSLSSVDIPYIAKVFQIVGNESKWIVYYYDERDKKRFLNTMLKNGVNEKNLSIESLANIKK